MYFNPLYIALIALGLVLMILTQWRVRSAFARYSEVPNHRQVVGGQLARTLLDSLKLYDIAVERIPGNLTDHYDPNDRVLRLSDGVYGGASVAALGVVAHEVGHAAQDATGYMPLRVRSGLVPMVNIGSILGYVFFFGGLVLHVGGLAWLGLAFFGAGILFGLVTVPVEINARRRAMQLLETNGLVDASEFRGARSILSAAVITYMISPFMGLFNLLFGIALSVGAKSRA